MLLPLILRIISRDVLGTGHSGGDAWDLQNFKSLVTFGDSYTDDSRLAYFGEHGGDAPPVGWKQEPNNASSDGGYIWARYASWYSGADLYNYAVSGAVCSNDISPRPFDATGEDFPDVRGYEIPAFLADKNFQDPYSKAPFLDIPAAETVYSMWIGTNDLGNGAFLTDGQKKGKTPLDYINCVYDAFDDLYKSGARYFVLMNVVPMQLLPQYAPADQGGAEASKYFTNKEDYPGIEKKMQHLVDLVNGDFAATTPFEVQIAERYPDAHFANFDVHGLFMDMYNEPSRYFNGSAPADSKQWINHCDLEGENCKEESSPDSYMWYDELHPSEQTGRNLAKEFVEVVKGKSKYASYWTQRKVETVKRNTSTSRLAMLHHWYIGLSMIPQIAWYFG